MINHLTLKNFKIHKEADLPLANLNILTGLNGTGKSSVIQSLLLLRQSYLNNNALAKGLLLNGDLINIGTGKDAFHISSGKLLEFSLLFDNRKKINWKFKSNTNDDFLLQAKYLKSLKNYSLEKISLFNQNFQYISAEHIGQMENHTRNSLMVKYNRQISEKFGRGEYVVHFLEKYGSDEVVSELLHHPKAINHQLLKQTDAWLGEISPGIATEIQANPFNESQLYLHFTYKTQGDDNHEFKPENVGFGVSYVLPIIAAVLSARKGSLILIENPEAHLHPSGQAKLAQLFALAAQSGIQLIIETHSDHIINGTLVAVKKYETEGKGISRDNVKIHFFSRDENEHASKIEQLPVLEGGRIRHPPYGFFDQIKQDIKILAGF